MLNVTKALQRPYTYIVLAILIVLVGVVSAASTPTDVFPSIDIPVASVIWQYAGASPNVMEKRIVYYAERSYSSAVSGIQHMESQTMPGMSVIKVYLQPGQSVDSAVAAITATSQNILKLLPPGITPPLIIQFNASTVPILQLGVSSPDLSEAYLNDYAQNFIRIKLASIRGAAIPSPYGGKVRTVMVDLNQQALAAKGLTPMDVANAINEQNLILPAGTAKMDTREYQVSINSSPTLLDELNDVPIKVVDGSPVYMRDVAEVHDGYAVQTNIVDKDGRPSVLLTVLKGGSASTLDIVSRIRAALPSVRATLPPDLHVDIVSDQSVFVRASVNSVIREAVIAAILTSLMILLFLGSWRSTLIVAMMIPLSILFSLACLSATGQTINVMTLGGLALAIGILVDNAIVSIENVYRNLGMGKKLHRAIIDGAEQIGAPQFVSTLAICIVFLPIMFLSGAAGSLFKPLAMAVVFAMVASYLLSRTFVPVVANMLLGAETHLHAHGHEPVGGDQMRHHAKPTHPGVDGIGAAPRGGDFIWRIHLRFNRLFERLLDGYRSAIQWAVRRRPAVLLGFGAFFALCCCLVPFIGEDFFPQVDSGSFRLHVVAPSGMRLEDTHRLFGQVEATISQVIPTKELNLTMDNIGMPVGGVNVAYNTTGTIGEFDGEILVQLNEDHRPTAEYIAELRRILPQRFSNTTFFFQPADITTQILNFGLPAPIDIQVVGNKASNFKIAQEIANQVKFVPGAADVHVHQVVDEPEIHIKVDRIKAAEMGITQHQVANNLLVSLSSSGQIMPNYWIDPKNGVSYLVAVQTPQYNVSNLSQITRLPMPGGEPGVPQPLSNLATLSRQTSAAVINHYDVQPTFDVYVNVQGRDLGGVARDIDHVLDSLKGKLPHGVTLVMRGQVESMNSSFMGLGSGLIAAIVLIYLLLVVNYQSWVDPVIIISALPGALSGILIILFVTSTTFSVPALMGAIMCVGVATANSILVVNFANDRREEGDDAVTAAVTAGCTRLRPVLMTALAMILGMLPMALALGEGGEQNAPLGRAVIGGLIVATVTTLLFVPLVYSVLRKGELARQSNFDGPDASSAVSTPA